MFTFRLNQIWFHREIVFGVVNAVIWWGSKASQKGAWSACREITCITGEMLAFSFIHFTLEKMQAFQLPVEGRRSSVVWVDLEHDVLILLLFLPIQISEQGITVPLSWHRKWPRIKLQIVFVAITEKEILSLISQQMPSKSTFKAASCWMQILLSKQVQSQGFTILQLHLSVRADKPASTRFPPSDLQ